MAVGGNIGIWESYTEPKMPLCKAQAAVLAGSQPAQAAAVFALCLRVSRSVVRGLVLMVVVDNDNRVERTVV